MNMIRDYLWRALFSDGSREIRTVFAEMGVREDALVSKRVIR